MRWAILNCLLYGRTAGGFRAWLQSPALLQGTSALVLGAEGWRVEGTIEAPAGLRGMARNVTADLHTHTHTHTHTHSTGPGSEGPLMGRRESCGHEYSQQPLAALGNLHSIQQASPDDCPAWPGHTHTLAELASEARLGAIRGLLCPKQTNFSATSNSGW